MTKEKAIQILNQRECCRECVVDNGDCNDCEKAFEMAIKALEQQPSEDCVSRQAVYFKLTNGAYSDENTEQFIDRLVKELEEMPPVTPTQCIAEVRFSKDELRDICNERIEVECTHGTCKDCKHCRTNYGNGRVYCSNLENNFEEDFYCKDFEKRVLKMRLIDADSIDYEDYWYNKGFSAIECQKAQQLINEQPTVQAIPIPENATNGDVIKAMFPNIEADEIKTNTGGYIEVKYLDTTDKCDATAFRKNWWNTPYKGVKE